MTEVASSVAAGRDAIGAALVGFCDHYLDGIPAPVDEAIRYSLLGEGKRMRGILFLSAFEAAGGAPGSAGAAALAGAVEVVHAYSLVHDDLPCMDDDDMRRGRPTVHRVYGVAAATAAGLAMVPLAARCAADAARALALDEAAVGTIVCDLMQASGAGGMIGGQLLDLEGEGTALALHALERIHRAKTGALITAAATLGGRAAGASSPRLQALAHYGAAVGLAFQIADDVLDVTATTDQLGKTAGRDLALQKSTYPALLGIEGARSRAEALIGEGCRALERVGLLTPALSRIARFTVERQS
ncbi:MAG: Polyprenyl synthetase [Gemmatimonadetes bacterium]|jgi:geranylgeranyl pyrophosphate synthase|nr:Polyprenyl synthetase [Gemmatimonadota bacterium]